MKSIFILKAFIFLYLCVSQEAVNCIKQNLDRKRLARRLNLHFLQKQYKLQLEQTALLGQKIVKFFMLEDSQAAAQLKQQLKDKLTQVGSTEVDMKKLLDQYIDQLKKDGQNDEKCTLIKMQQNNLINSYLESAKQQKIIDTNQKNPSDSAVDQQGKKYVSSLADSQLVNEQFATFKYQKSVAITGALQSKDISLEKDKMFISSFKEAVATATPEKFCWKNNMQFKSECPSTHPVKVGPLCHNTCDQFFNARPNLYTTAAKMSYNQWLGVCTEKCGPNQQNCWEAGPSIRTGNGWFDWWHPKYFFVTDAITILDSNVKCPPGMNSGSSWTGLMCYPDQPQLCGDLGRANCGGELSCGVNSQYCGQAIENMAKGTVSGLLKAASFALTFGIDSTVTTALDAIKAGLDFAKQLFDMYKFVSNLINMQWDGMDLLSKVVENPTMRALLVKDSVKNLKILSPNYIKEKAFTDAELTLLMDNYINKQTGYISQSQSQKVAVNNLVNQINNPPTTPPKNGAPTLAEICKSKPIIDNGIIWFNFVDKGSLANWQKGQSQALSSALMMKLNGTSYDKLPLKPIFDIGTYLDMLAVFDKGNKYFNKNPDLNSSKEGMDFAKSIVGFLADLDPTGILTIAKAFMYNSCPIVQKRRFQSITSKNYRKKVQLKQKYQIRHHH